MLPEQKFKLIALSIACAFILGAFYITASFTQSNIDVGEVILSIVTVLSALLSILGIEFAKPKG